MELDEFLRNYVVGDDPKLNEKMDSKQYPLSNEIMELETKLGVDQKQTAKLAHISLAKLLRLESVDLTIPVSEYQQVIAILKADLNKVKEQLC